MKQVIITGSEKRINELKRFISSYVKAKDLILKDVEDVTLTESKEDGFILSQDENSELAEKKEAKKQAKKKD